MNTELQKGEEVNGKQLERVFFFILENEPQWLK